MGGKIIKLSVFLSGIILFIAIYKMVDPAKSQAFPKCIIHSATGYECPGCGSQRVIHHLLNLEIAQAFKQNPLLVSLIPYFILGFFVEYMKPSKITTFLRKKLYGVPAILIVLLLVIAFTLWRNGFF